MEFDEASYPRCLTRSGVVPLHSGLSATVIQKVHEILIRAARYFEYRDERFVNVDEDEEALTQNRL